jgi:Tfp pilus assembly protein PilV
MLPSLKRTCLRPSDEAGFTLAEVVLGLAIFLIVATALGGLLVSATLTYGQSRERTLAVQAAMQQLEVIRRMPYENIGVANGNPPGTIAATKAITLTGIKATMAVQVRYVDDQTPNSYRTYANYKQVTITITRDRDSKRLAREVTYISPATRASSSDTVIKASILDLNKLTGVADTTVNLSTGPSAPRSDVTDAGGNAVFPGLTANPSSGPQAYYDLSLTPPTGYESFADDRSPSTNAHLQLGISAQPNPVLRVYRPSTINVSSPAPAAPAGSAVPYTISVGSDRGAQAFTQPAGTTSLGVSSITAGLLAAEPILPLPSPTLNFQYLAGASAVSGTNYYYSTAVTQPVPSAYPTTLTQSFNLGAGTWYTAAQVKPLTVKVQNGSGALNGAAVAVSGGPGAAPGIYVAGVTSTSSIASTLSSGTISSPAGGGASSGTISPPGGANYASGTISTGTSSTSGTITSHSWSSGNWYTSVSANCSSQTAGSCNTTPAAGTITSASFSFGSAIGASSSYSVTLYKNGASTGASCTISGGQADCTISGASVAVNGTSDTVVLVVSRTSGSGTSYTGTGTGTVSTSGTWSSGNWYTSVSANCASQTSTNCGTTPAAGTITGASFSFGSAIGGSSSYSVTLYKNGASTGSSCTIGGGQTGCTISGASVAVNGTTDKIVLVVSRTSGTGTSYTGTATATATAGGSWSAGNWYTSLSANCTSQTAGSCNTTPAAGTITGASFSFASAIGSSASYSVTLYKNGASTGSSCTVAASQTGCTISGLNLAVNGTDTVVLVVNRTAGTSYTGNASTSYSTLGSWSSGNWYVSLSANCASQTAGSCTTTPAAGSITGASFSFGSAIGAGSSYSVTLYKNGASTGASCAIAGGQTGCTITSNVSVNGTSDTVVLVVSRTSGSGTSYNGTASASASHSTPPAAGQITFNVPSGSGYTITAWGASTSAQLTGQTVTSATTKTLTVS